MYFILNVFRSTETIMHVPDCIGNLKLLEITNYSLTVHQSAAEVCVFQVSSSRATHLWEIDWSCHFKSVCFRVVSRESTVNFIANKCCIANQRSCIWNRESVAHFLHHLSAEEVLCAVTLTCASTRRCLIRVMDFCMDSFSGGRKGGSSCSRGFGPVTMKLAIWSFRLFRDCTAKGRHKNKCHYTWAVNTKSVPSINNKNVGDYCGDFNKNAMFLTFKENMASQKQFKC